MHEQQSYEYKIHNQHTGDDEESKDSDLMAAVFTSSLPLASSVSIANVGAPVVSHRSLHHCE